MATKKTSKNKSSTAERSKTAVANAAVTKLDLPKIRAQIDAIDDQLLKLLSERATFAQSVGLSKKSEVTVFLSKSLVRTISGKRFSVC